MNKKLPKKNLRWNYPTGYNFIFFPLRKTRAGSWENIPLKQSRGNTTLLQQRQIPPAKVNRIAWKKFRAFYRQINVPLITIWGLKITSVSPNHETSTKLLEHTHLNKKANLLKIWGLVHNALSVITTH